jgi:hypothetical protein
VSRFAYGFDPYGYGLALKILINFRPARAPCRAWVALKLKGIRRRWNFFLWTKTFVAFIGMGTETLLIFLKVCRIMFFAIDDPNPNSSYTLPDLYLDCLLA